MPRLLQFSALVYLVGLGFSQPAFAQDEVAETKQAAKVVGSETAETTSVSLDFLQSGEVPTSLLQLKAMETHVAELTERVLPAIVNIQVGPAQGSGVVVSRSGHILTAAHVIGRPNLPATITFPDGKKVAAKTLGVNRAVDSGMLKIEEKGRWPYLDIGESESLNLGQWLVAIGHPEGIDLKRGLVLRVGRMLYGSDDVLNTDCTLVGGDSGGPLIDMDGNVVGIHSRIGGRLTDNIHVPIDVFSRDWDQLANGERVGEKPRPQIGISIVEDTNEIEVVAEDGPAGKAGLKKGDRIINIGDAEIENRDDIETQWLRIEPGDKITIVVLRDEKEMTFELTVGERW